MGRDGRASVGLAAMTAVLLVAATAMSARAQDASSSPPAPASPPAAPSSAPPPSLAPVDWIVDSTADAADAQPGDGICATATNACTLRAAVQEAAADAGARVIELPAGVFGLRAGDPREDASVDGDLDIAGTLEVRGAGADATSISGGRTSRLFQVLTGGSLTLRSLALVDGSSSDGKAGAVDNAGRLVIEDARVEGNTATGPGAILSSGSLVVRRTIFIDDRADRDGGAVQVLAGTASLEDSDFERDRSNGTGGALLVSGGSVSVTRTRFSLNEAYGGAAIAAVGGSTTVDASTFDQGRAFLGGALYVRQASGSTSLAVTASSFARNVATAPGLGGGAMAVLGGHVQVDASTFAANTSSAAGGGAVSLSSGSMAMLDSTFDGDIAVASGDILSVGAGRPRKRALPYDLSIGWSTLVAGARPAIGVDKRRIKGDRTTITGSMVLSQAPAGACTGAPPTSGGGNIGDDSCGLTAVTDRPATQPSPTLVPGASAMPGVQPSSAPGTDAWAWLVGPLADNGGPTLTRLPVEGSIAVDATAGVAGCPAVDQRGVPRPQGPACDAGAVEVGPTP